GRKTRAACSPITVCRTSRATKSSWRPARTGLKTRTHPRRRPGTKGRTRLRKPPNDTPGVSHTPERKCILSGEHAARDDLIRLALGPDGTVAPDVRARAPGRGAWLGVDRATLDAANRKGKLKGALA